MSDVVYIGNRAANVEASPLFNTYSRVTIHIDDDTTVSVGDDTGRELEFSNPFGSEAMARSILQKLSGFQYQPHETSGALLNPAAEIGDAVSVSNIYAGIFNRSRQFGRLMKADISAPCDEEINHEYQFESPLERKFTREVGTVRASLILTNNMIQAEVVRATGAEETLSSRVTQTESSITSVVSRVTGVENEMSQIRQEAGEISAKVSETGGNNSSFGWSLKSGGHYWYAGNKQVMKVTSEGLEVDGKVTASTGQIGGFTISASALSYNGMTWSDSTKDKGIYIGASGIKLGQNFQVNTSGNITANNMTLTGTLKVGGKNITAENLRVGAQQSATNYSKWTTASNSVSTNGNNWTSGYNWTAKAGNASTGVNYIRATNIYAVNNLTAGNIYIGSHKLSLRTAKDGDGNQIAFVGWGYDE